MPDILIVSTYIDILYVVLHSLVRCLSSTPFIKRIEITHRLINSSSIKKAVASPSNFLSNFLFFPDVIDNGTYLIISTALKSAERRISFAPPSCRVTERHTYILSPLQQMSVVISVYALLDREKIEHV